MKIIDDFDKMECVDLNEIKYMSVLLPYAKGKNTEVKVPRFFVNAFTFLHKREYLDMEGIFRKQGNASKIRDTQCFLSGDIDETLTVYDVCVLVKRFIKSIRGGLFYTKEERVLDMAFDPRGMNTPRTLCQFCHTLPVYNYGILAYIIFQLARVVRHSGYNKMDADNLAIVFVPTMFQSFVRKANQGPMSAEGVKKLQESYKETVIMLINSCSELLIPQVVLRNNSITRPINFPPRTVLNPSNIDSSGALSSPHRNKGLPKRSISLSGNRPAVSVPRYTHAAAQNGRSGLMMSEPKNRERRMSFRAARKRSASIARTVVSFLAGTSSEQYCVNENLNPAKL